MQFIQDNGEQTEYFFKEGCHITELLNSPENPEISVARARVEPGQTTRWHRLTDIAEHYLIVEGRGLAEVGEKSVYEVSAEDVVVIPAGVRQRITNTGEVDLLFLAICTPRFVPEAYHDIEAELD
ncbi:MAG: cupin domain-containing protein [Gammaproteobacteria bacterium]|nr:cupin domain-containing protein [Gammaproteobacteria bacterium]